MNKIVSIDAPVLGTFLGTRENNEDAVFPLPGMSSPSDQLFIVCDGVGGAMAGEVASRIATESLAEFFLRYPIEGYLTEEYLQQATDMARSQIDEYLAANSRAKGMATTITLLHLNREGCSLAHMGDSRVYHFRNGQMIFRTQDHALVAELLAEGLITTDQAANHPHKNVITRALSGSHEKARYPDLYQVPLVLPGDVFLLCTDGVNERIPDEVLETICGATSVEDMAGAIQAACAPLPGDNYSFCLVKVLDQVQGLAPVTAHSTESATKDSSLISLEVEDDDIPDISVHPVQSLAIRPWMLALAVFLAVLAVGAWGYDYFILPPKNEQVQSGPATTGQPDSKGSSANQPGSVQPSRSDPGSGPSFERTSEPTAQPPAGTTSQPTPPGKVGNIFPGGSNQKPPSQISGISGIFPGRDTITEVSDRADSIMADDTLQNE